MGLAGAELKCLWKTRGCTIHRHVENEAGRDRIKVVNVQFASRKGKHN